MSVIYIRIGYASPTKAQNALRYVIELGIWRHQWRIAEANNNYEEMDRLDCRYEMVGLP